MSLVSPRRNTVPLGTWRSWESEPRSLERFDGAVSKYVRLTVSSKNRRPMLSMKEWSLLKRSGSPIALGSINLSSDQQENHPMLYLGIDQHARQITISLREERFLRNTSPPDRGMAPQEGRFRAKGPLLSGFVNLAAPTSC